MADITPKYYQEFNCLGEKCEETCCQGWVISIDKNTYQKYESLKDEMFHKNPHFNKMPEPTENFHGIIKMKKDGFCPFLNGKNLCNIQKNYGEEYLSSTCKTFPRRNIKYSDSQNIRTLSMACPEAARLCLTEEDSMKIFEDNHYEKKNYIEIVPKELKDSYNTVGEKLFNKTFTLLKDKNICLTNVLFITEQFLNEQNNLTIHQDKLEDITKHLVNKFIPINIVNFDNLIFKLTFLEDVYGFINNITYDNKSNEKFKHLLKQVYEELVGKFKSFDEVKENFNKSLNLLNKFDSKKHIYRKYFQNEMLSHAQIFTNNTPFCRNRFYITIFCASLSKLISISKISNNQGDVKITDLTEPIQKVSKHHGFFLKFYKNMEYKFNEKIMNSLNKVDENNIFNSVLFLFH